MQAVKILKIKLDRGIQEIPDTFKLENYAVKVEIDYTDCGVAGLPKFVDLRNAGNEDFRYDLGTDDVVSFYLTNDVTHVTGELQINPLVMHEFIINGKERTQLIGFKTFKFYVKDSIAVYEATPGSEGQYDDVILPIQKDVLALQTLINNHEDRISILETLSGGTVENPDLAILLGDMQNRIGTNETDILALIQDISDANDLIQDLAEDYNTTYEGIKDTVTLIEQDLGDLEQNTGNVVVPGPSKDDGQGPYPTYVWIKYADSPTSGLSTSSLDKTYIGYGLNRLVKRPPKDTSDSYANYKWELMDDNTEGILVDGKYVWIKHADNLQGANMVDNPKDKMFIGLSYDNFTEVKSENPEDYDWYMSPGYFGDQLIKLTETTHTQGTAINQNTTDIGLVASDIETIDIAIFDPVTGLAETHSKTIANEGSISTMSDSVNILVSEVIEEDGQVQLNKTAISAAIGQINLKVSIDDLMSQINLNTEGILIKGENINLTGATSFNDNVTISTTGKIKAIDAEFVNAIITGNLNAGKLGNLIVNSSGVSFPSSGLKLNSSTSSIDFNSLKMTHIYSLPPPGASIGGPVVSLDMARFKSTNLTGEVIFGVSNYGGFIATSLILPSDSSKGIAIGDPNTQVYLPVAFYMGGTQVYVDGNGYVRSM